MLPEKGIAFDREAGTTPSALVGRLRENQAGGHNVDSFQEIGDRFGFEAIALREGSEFIFFGCSEISLLAEANQIFPIH